MHTHQLTQEEDSHAADGEAVPGGEEPLPTWVPPVPPMPAHAAPAAMVPSEGPPPAAWQPWTTEPWVPIQGTPTVGERFVEVEPLDSLQPTNPNMFNECRKCHSRTYFKKISKGPAPAGTVVV